MRVAVKRVRPETIRRLSGRRVSLPQLQANIVYLSKIHNETVDAAIEEIEKLHQRIDRLQKSLCGLDD